jgi:hypothetical protein
MRKRFTLISMVALLLMATVPGVAFAARSFSAGGELDRVYAGDVSFPAAYGGAMLTEDQVFTGTLDSDWKQLDGADIVVNQNSWIAADVASLLGTGTGAVWGQAWGSFTVSKGQNSLVGSYGADLAGTVSITSPLVCDPTNLLSPHPSIYVPLAFSISDVGGWSAITGTEGGAYNAINESGGSLIADPVTGCIGSEENATVQITGLLGQSK